jgi:hypothetical protein
LARLAFEALRAETQREVPSPTGTEYLLTTELVLRESTALAADWAAAEGIKKGKPRQV